TLFTTVFVLEALTCLFSLPAAFLCPDTLRYQACLPTCTSQSCPNHDYDSDPDQCSGLTEGCVCPEGTLLHRPYSALCISPEKCGKT
uniref:TIL domain-containing protein n=1 Tax=Labrus bergylta TaxID=56723 RepID=A0A3Q3GTT1_9LABR